MTRTDQERQARMRDGEEAEATAEVPAQALEALHVAFFACRTPADLMALERRIDGILSRYRLAYSGGRALFARLFALQDMLVDPRCAARQAAVDAAGMPVEAAYEAAARLPMILAGDGTWTFDPARFTQTFVRVRR